MAVFEVPLSGSMQSFSMPVGGVVYQFRFVYADVEEAGWLVDISDAEGVPLVCGIPLVTGADLMEQFVYLGIAARFYVLTDGDAAEVPTFENLGTRSHLYFETA